MAGVRAVSSSPDEILVVGAGVGGVAVALWLRDLELPFRWVDSASEVGGTLLRVGNPIPNYPGVEAANGRELVAALRRQLASFELAPEFGIRLLEIDARTGAGATVVLREENGESTRTYSTIVLATGTQPRLLGLEDERALLGQGVEISVTSRRDDYRGEPVAVVGGGDAACEGALLLAEACPIVHLVHRRDGFRAQRRFLDRIATADNVRVHTPRAVDRLRSDGGRLVGVELDDGTTLDVSGLFVRIGVQPAVPPCQPSLDVGPHGYLRTDEDGRCSVPGVWAVGDVRRYRNQAVATTVGDATVVTKTLQKERGDRGRDLSLDA